MALFTVVRRDQDSCVGCLNVTWCFTEDAKNAGYYQKITDLPQTILKDMPCNFFETQKGIPLQSLMDINNTFREFLELLLIMKNITISVLQKLISKTIY